MKYQIFQKLDMNANTINLIGITQKMFDFDFEHIVLFQISDMQILMILFDIINKKSLTRKFCEKMIYF